MTWGIHFYNEFNKGNYPHKIDWAEEHHQKDWLIGFIEI